MLGPKQLQYVGRADKIHAHPADANYRYVAVAILITQSISFSEVCLNSG